MSIDKYFNRRYSAKNYNCAHLVCEVWQDLTGVDISHSMSGFLCAPTARTVPRERLRVFRVVPKPVTPCIVFMQRLRSPPHVGIWVRGRVLHILENSKVQYQPLDVVTRGFKKVRFVVC